MDFEEADLSYLTDLAAGDPSIIRELLTMFVDKTPKDVSKLAEYVSKKEWPGTASMAHHIKPTLAYVGAEDMRLEMQWLEDATKRTEIPESEIVERFNLLKKRFAILVEELIAYLATI